MTTWRQALANETPLILPVAHDALTARLIAQAGFSAFAVGGFAVAGCRHGLPDVGLMSFGEMRDGMAPILETSTLPVLVDADDGYGDVKNVARTVRAYETMGAAALLLEDQVSPKRCGHMAGKSVIPPDAMEAKIRAAVDARRNADTFLIARTDARAVHGLDDALERARRYLAAGADGLFVEAPESEAELATVGSAFPGVPQLANMLEDGRKPPMAPDRLAELGFAMVAYPVTLLFRMVRAAEDALKALRRGELASPEDRIGFGRFQEIVGLPDWSALEDATETDGT